MEISGENNTNKLHVLANQRSKIYDRISTCPIESCDNIEICMGKLSESVYELMDFYIDKELHGDANLLIQKLLSARIESDQLIFEYNREAKETYMIGSLHGRAWHTSLRMIPPSHTEKLITEFSCGYKAFLSQIKFLIDTTLRASKEEQTFQNTKKLDAYYKTTAFGLLTQGVASQVERKKQDIADTQGVREFRSVEDFATFVYATDPAYLHNIFLGFDPHDNSVLTTEQKAKNFQSYLYDENGIDTSEELQDEQDEKELQIVPLEKPFRIQTGEGGFDVSRYTTVIDQIKNNIDTILTPHEILYQFVRETRAGYLSSEQFLHDHITQWLSANTGEQRTTKEEMITIYSQAYNDLEQQCDEILNSKYQLIIQGSILEEELKKKLLYNVYDLEYLYSHASDKVLSNDKKIPELWERSGCMEYYTSCLSKKKVSANKFRDFLCEQYLGDYSHETLPYPSLGEFISRDRGKLPLWSPEYNKWDDDRFINWFKRNLQGNDKEAIAMFSELYVVHRRNYQEYVEQVYRDSRPRIAQGLLDNIDKLLDDTQVSQTTLFQEFRIGYLQLRWRTHISKGNEYEIVVFGGHTYPRVVAMFIQIIDAVVEYCKQKNYQFSPAECLKASQYHIGREGGIERFFILVDHYDASASIDQMYWADRLDKISIYPHLGGLNTHEKIRALAIKHRIPCKKLIDHGSSYSSLEKMAIKRMRVPEPLKEKYSKEFGFDRYSGSCGYVSGDLQDIMQLLPLLAESGSSLDLKTMLDLDYRVFENISPDMRLDLDMSVPIKADRPYVDVHIHGYLSEDSIARGWYLLVMDIEKKSLRLIYDTTVIDTTMLQHKYSLHEKHAILGGGWMQLYRDRCKIELSGRVDTYNHEPRIITATALVNAIEKMYPGTARSIFLGDDGYVKMKNYF